MKRQVCLIGCILLFLTVSALLCGCPKKKPVDIGGGGRVQTQLPVQDLSGGNAGHEGKAQITVRVLNGEDRVGSNSKIYIYKPDNHQNAVATPKDGIAEFLPDGDYDVRAVYADDKGMSHEKWSNGVKLSADKPIDVEIVFTTGKIAIEAGGAGTAYTAKDISVRVYPAGNTGKSILEATADAPIELLPGEYDLSLELTGVSEQGSAWRRGIKVSEGETTSVDVNFTGGSLIIKLQGGKSLPGARVAVYNPGETTTAIAEGEPGDEFPINSGEYDIKVNVGQGDGKYEYWEKGISVELGEVNRLDIKLPVGTIKVNAFMTGIGQIAGGDFTVFVYKQGDTASSIVQMSGEETIALEAGTYDLRVEYTNSQDKPSVWIKGVTSTAGQHQTLRADFTSTSITVSAYVGKTELPGNQVQVYYYKAEDTSKFITSTIAGVPAVLSEGRYKLKLEFTGGPYTFDEWAGEYTLETGKALTVDYKLNAGWLKLVTSNGELKDAHSNTVLGTFKLGDELLVPVGIYFLTTDDGTRLMVDVGAGGKHQV